MRRVLFTSVAVAVTTIVLAGPALAAAELRLRDGQVLTGTSVERREDLYLLELQDGSLLPVPMGLVDRVRLTGRDAPRPSGLTPTESQALTEPPPWKLDPEQPSGLSQAEPETLAGPPGDVTPPAKSEMLAVLADSKSTFPDSVIDPYWHPSSDWSTDPYVTNQFNPTRWSKSPIDPYWAPSWGLGPDATQFRPTRWSRSPIDPHWYPTDGFRRD